MTGSAPLPSVFVTTRFAPVRTVELAVALLFEPFGSPFEELAETTSVMVLFSAALDATLTCIVIVAEAPTARVLAEQVKAPENRPAWMPEKIWKPFVKKEKIETLE